MWLSFCFRIVACFHFCFIIFIGAGADTVVSSLPWLGDNYLFLPLQMCSVINRDGVSRSIVVADENAEGCVKRIHSVDKGAISILHFSTCQGQSEYFPRGVVALPSSFGVAGQEDYSAVITLGVFFGGVGDKLFYTGIDIATGDVSVVRTVKTELGYPFMMSDVFHWQGSFRFFVPQYTGMCVTLLISASDVVDIVNGTVKYGGEALTASVAAGKCRSEGDVDGRALTQAKMGKLWSVAHFRAIEGDVGGGGVSAIYISDYHPERKALRRCAPISPDGTSVYAYCIKLFVVSSTSRGITVIPPTSTSPLARLIWCATNATSHNVYLVVDDTRRENASVLQIQRILTTEVAPNYALPLSDGRILVSFRSSEGKNTLLLLSNVSMPSDESFAATVSQSVSLTSTMSPSLNFTNRSTTLSISTCTSSNNGSRTRSFARSDTISCGFEWVEVLCFFGKCGSLFYERKRQNDAKRGLHPQFFVRAAQSRYF